MKQQFSAYKSLTRAIFIALIRNKSSVFFGFIFPLVFIGVFSLLGKSTNSYTVGYIGTESNPSQIITAIKKLDFVKIEYFNTTDGLDEKLRKGDLDGYIESTNNKSTLFTNSSRPSQSNAVKSVISGINDKLNLIASGVDIKNPPIQVDYQDLSLRKYNYIDFALPGQIGFSLMSGAIFGGAFGIIFLKKTKVLKRIFASPTKPLTFVLAQGTARLILTTIQTSVIIVAGVYLFGFNPVNGIYSLINMLIISMIGLFAFFGFGLFISGLSKDEQSASPMVNLITTPQFILAGSFFSISTFPLWLQKIANVLPLTFLNNAMRLVANDGVGIVQVLPQLAGLLVWALIMYTLAALTFKAE